jgi:N-acetylneuraminic acid mutarotase
MKMFRLALAGVLPAFVLLVCIQLNARVAFTPPPDMQSWFTGDDTVNDHIWQPVGALYNGAAPSQSRQLLFEDRVAYQRLIEEVYWRHRIWPKERTDRKPSLDAVMSQATIEKKVEDYLRNSELLEQDWSKPITPEQLQAEMDRMAQHTKQPEVLRELFAALGNDPFVIAECLARPVLAERFANGDPVVAASNAFGAAHPAGIPPQKPVVAGWLAKAERQVPVTMAAVTANYTLPAILDQPSGCIDDSWTATTTTNAPTARSGHTAVWTGSEMIVWGGSDGVNYFNTGGRYNPGTDSWTATSTTNAPTGRYGHTAVWTGSEMIVWGGYDGSMYLNTGGRYNPITDSWTATSTTNAPTGRYLHTAVWTNSEMIIWAGRNENLLITGGRYNPNTDSWTNTSTTSAPVARVWHTAVWTGSEMIVWGGTDPDGEILNTGGRYNPSADGWTATTTANAPSSRFRHTAVWAGSEMIIWGGLNQNFVPVNTGGRYDPGTDSWTATSTTNAPTPRASHTAVWTGSEMIVWGGGGDNTGGRYCAQAAGPTPTPTPAPITLSAAKRKVEGINTVRLTWSGATSTHIDVYRDAVLIVTTANHASYVDSTGDTGRARYTYRVCEAGTSTCSNHARVTFPH